MQITLPDASHAEGTKAASGEVVLSSGELGRQATELHKQVADFLSYIRAA